MWSDSGHLDLSAIFAAAVGYELAPVSLFWQTVLSSLRSPPFVLNCLLNFVRLERSSNSNWNEWDRGSIIAIKRGAYVWLRLIPWVVLVAPEVVYGQRLSFGFVGGTNFTRDFPISRTVFQDETHPTGLTTFDLFSDTHSFIAGLSVELNLGKGLSLEGNALRRKLQLSRRFIFPDGSLQDFGRVSVSTWEWPILLKQRLPLLGPVRAFVEGGPSFRTRHNPSPTEPSQIGGTVGAGAEFHARGVRLSPAIRYTRWQFDGDYPRIATKRDQIEFVMGISYATSVPSWKIGDKKVRFGLIGGIPLRNGLKESSDTERMHELPGYTAGVSVGIELDRRFSIVANGLYRPFRAEEFSVSEAAGELRFEFTVLTWQVPVLAKYHFRSRSKVQLVTEMGPSFRFSGNLNGYSPSSFGFTAGAGVEIEYKAMKIGPVLRYTRWAADATAFPRGPQTAPNQLDLLVSFTF